MRCTRDVTETKRPAGCADGVPAGRIWGGRARRGTARRPMGPSQYTNVEAELMQEVRLLLAAPVPLRHQLLVLLP